jgi:hypothetical protein
MATYALTFATRAAFDTSLASGDIYNLMQGVTSSKPSVAITATITESGETFACGTNVMVDIKSVGPGDRIMYDSTNAKYFGIASKWIDNNYPNQPTQHIMIFKTGVLPARYVDCGVCVRRFGNRIRVAGSSASKVWASGNWNVASLPIKSTVIKKSRTDTTYVNGTGWLSFYSSRYQEARFPNGDSTYLVITRAAWNAAVIAGNDTVTGNGKTVTLADYDFSYDKFLAYNYAPLFPDRSGAFIDTNGMADTVAIVSDFVANHGKTTSSDDYAAGYCYNYSINAPGLGKHQWFFGTIKDISEVRLITYALPTPIAWSSEFLWSATQYSSGNAWYMSPAGATRYNSMTAGQVVIPLADIILEN